MVILVSRFSTSNLKLTVHLLSRFLCIHGGLDLVDFHTKLYAHYGPGTDYERATQEAAQKVKPVNGPWPNGAVKNFLKTYAANKEAVIGDPNIMDMDAVFFAIPVMVLYAGKPDLQEQVERTVRILQVRPSVQVHIRICVLFAFCVQWYNHIHSAHTHTHTHAHTHTLLDE